MKDLIGAALMKWRIRTVLEALQGDVLDVGCETNELIKKYRIYNTRERGKNFAKISIASELRAIGVDIHPWEGVDKIIENSANLPFTADSFDTVCCIAALTHIPERKEFLKEAKRILRSHGKLVLTMLLPGISRAWHFLCKTWDVDQKVRGMKEGEVYGLDENSMKTMLDNAGFFITHVSSFMLGLNKLYIAEKILGIQHD